MKRIIKKFIRKKRIVERTYKDKDRKGIIKDLYEKMRKERRM
jgi:hypothetical protein